MGIFLRRLTTFKRPLFVAMIAITQLSVLISCSSRSANPTPIPQRTPEEFFLLSKLGDGLYFTNSLSGAQRVVSFPLVVPGELPQGVPVHPFITGQLPGTGGLSSSKSIVFLDYINVADLTKALNIIETDDSRYLVAPRDSKQGVRHEVVINHWITEEHKISYSRVEGNSPVESAVPLKTATRTPRGQWELGGVLYEVIAYGFTDDEFWSLVDSMITK